MPMVDINTTEGYKSINGSTLQENRELNGELNPTDNVMSTRPEFFKAQLKHIQDTLDDTTEETNNLAMKEDNKFNEKYRELQERTCGLIEATNLIENQIEKETVREQQEEDI